jgi:membrane dipeptidase
MMSESTETRIARLHRNGVNGIVDMHHDLLMDLYEKRNRTGVLGSDFWPEMSAGNMGVVAAAIYIEDKYVPEMALRVALGQVARLHTEVAADPRFAICRSYAEIVAARQRNQIAFIITMEGVEPLGNDINLVRAFYELGVRSIGLTHVRRNMAGDGGVFAPSGSSPQGLTAFGKAVVRECEALGIIVDLAHLNPAGVSDVLAMATKPMILSHTNPRHFYDIERNSNDDQLRAVAQRGGVIGVNSVLLSPHKDKATIDGFVDQIEYISDLCGIQHVAIGFDFFDFIYQTMPAAERAALEKAMTSVHFPPGLLNHAHTHNLTRKLIERGFSDADIEAVLWGNWMRVLQGMR